LITIEHLKKTYGGERGLLDFSLQVPAGSLFGLVGPNGAGKTTLIKVLATLLRPDAGRVRVGERDVVGDPRGVRSVTGYLPDVPGFYQEMTVREYLEFFADAFHIRGAERGAAVEHGLEMAGLRERTDSYVEALSLGLRQRLGLAKILLHRPKLLLLDEPANGLDPLARIEFRERLKQLHAGGVTILISSHILSDLEDICTDVALITEGRNAGEAPLAAKSATAESALMCELEVMGDTAPALAVVHAMPEATLLSQDGRRLEVRLLGGEKMAAALLRALVTSGVDVLRFAPRSPDLEDHYRQAFGGQVQ